MSSVHPSFLLPLFPSCMPLHTTHKKDEQNIQSLKWLLSQYDYFLFTRLSRSSRSKPVSEGVVWCRDGAEDLCHKLHHAGVPVLVLSAGMGDVLEQVLRHFNVYTDNVKVVSNFFEYNDEVRNSVCVCVCLSKDLHESNMEYGGS